MVPKVLINPQFSFGEMSKAAVDMKEHLDDICKKDLSKISRTGNTWVAWKPPARPSSAAVCLHS